MTEATQSEVLVRAHGLAESAHGEINHVRKYTGEPYINHLTAVVDLVDDVDGTEDMMAAAWLHDVIEDTPTTYDDVREIVSENVADLVLQLTDVSRPQDGNRAIRKAMDREHLAKASPEAQTIKLADLIDNARSITKHDERFAKTFMLEMKDCMEVLTDGAPQLYRMAERIVAEWKERGVT